MEISEIEVKKQCQSRFDLQRQKTENFAPFFTMQESSIAFHLGPNFYFPDKKNLRTTLADKKIKLNLILGLVEQNLKSQKLPIFSGDISKLCKLPKIASKLVPMHSLQDSTLIRGQNHNNRSLRTNLFFCNSRIS